MNTQGKAVKKQISINSFPQPPRGLRTSSLPPSPLSGGTTPATTTSSAGGSRRDSSGTSPVGSSSTAKTRKRPKRSSNPKPTSYVGGSTPSLLNGSGDSRSISSGPGARGSDGLLSLPSPPQSRSSSAQDSYSTSATTYDDNGEGPRGRDDTNDAATDDSSKKAHEGKGNVIVSVRVRPDTAGERSKSDGEWMVDGRKSLVAYKGKEGGDYYYGRTL